MSGAQLRRVIERELSGETELDSSFATLLPEDDGAPQAMDTEEDAVATVESKPQESNVGKASVELEAYLHLLTVCRLIDDKSAEEAAQCALVLVEKVKSFVSRTLNPIAAKAYFYLSWAHEMLGGPRYAAIRSTLLSAHITASLQRANESQVTLLNALLRNYLQHSLFDQADKLASKSSRVADMLSDGSVSNNQIARYLHYQGHIKAVQLAYGSAYEYLEESLRKAPRGTALGFRMATYKLLTIVQLLMGEIPERSVFTQPNMAGQLRPYFLLAKAVRLGDLHSYNKAVAEHKSQFTRDGTQTLVVRLRHNVIKTGLRKINLAYAKIGFQDICDKLRLDSVKDAEYIVAKAIRDGVVEARIDHAGGFMESRPMVNVYNTTEPYEQFHKRIEFCINIRNDAVKAMRFPEKEVVPDVLKDDTKKEDAAAVVATEINIEELLEDEDDEE